MKNNEGYILEFIRNGDFVKVSAVDPRTGEEAAIIAPAKGVTQKYMSDLAIKKLQYVQNKKKNEENLY